MILAMASVSAPASAARDPYGIFNAARLVWEQAVYPSYVRYNIVVRVDENGVAKSSHYNSLYDATSDLVRVDGVSEEQRAHPHVAPTGVNFNIMGIGVSKPEEPVDYLGIPELAPNYSFGIASYVPGRTKDPAALVAAIRRQFHDPAPRPTARPANGGLKVIGDVEAMRRNYVMTYDGIEPIDGHLDYHLSLRPTHEPKKYRLRELWIDDRSFMTDRLTSDGNFTDGPAAGVPWTVTFTQLDGAPIIATESTTATLNAHARAYSNISIAFEAMDPLANMPLELNLETTSGQALREPQ
ncbi:MAG TPA: hypothetical protein VIG32_02380 [Candidatus Baltobacteraceae bacterium]